MTVCIGALAGEGATMRDDHVGAGLAEQMIAAPARGSVLDVKLLNPAFGSTP